MSCTLLKTLSPGWHRVVWMFTFWSPFSTRNLCEYHLLQCFTGKLFLAEKKGEKGTIWIFVTRYKNLMFVWISRVPRRRHKNNLKRAILLKGSTITCWEWHIKCERLNSFNCREREQQSHYPEKLLRDNKFWTIVPALPAAGMVQWTAQWHASQHIISSPCVMLEPKWDSEYAVHRITENVSFLCFYCVALFWWLTNSRL